MNNEPLEDIDFKVPPMWAVILVLIISPVLMVIEKVLDLVRRGKCHIKQN